MALNSIKAGVTQGLKSVDAFKKNFFDAPGIVAAMDKATAKTFSRFGAFVRRRAQTSIKYRLKVSEPGAPPSGHRTMMKRKTNRKTGVTKLQPSSPLREFIFFAYDPATQSVVIGPAKTNQKNSFADRPIPQVLEEGGSVSMREHLHSWADGRQTWERTDLRYRLSSQNYRSAVGKATRTRVATIAARPFMHPALNAELHKLAPMYANTLTPSMYSKAFAWPSFQSAA